MQSGHAAADHEEAGSYALSHVPKSTCQRDVLKGQDRLAALHEVGEYPAGCGNFSL
jgi:hypothetical protein